MSIYSYATIIWMLLIFHFFRASHLRIIRPSYLENLCCNLKRHYVDFLHWYLCRALIFTIFHLIMHIWNALSAPTHPFKPTKFSDNQISRLFDSNDVLSLPKYTSLNKIWNVPSIAYKKGNILAHVFLAICNLLDHFKCSCFFNASSLLV